MEDVAKARKRSTLLALVPCLPWQRVCCYRVVLQVRCRCCWCHCWNLHLTDTMFNIRSRDGSTY